MNELLNNLIDISETKTNFAVTVAEMEKELNLLRHICADLLARLCLDRNRQMLLEGNPSMNLTQEDVLRELFKEVDKKAKKLEAFFLLKEDNTEEINLGHLPPRIQPSTIENVRGELWRTLTARGVDEEE